MTATENFQGTTINFRRTAEGCLITEGNYILIEELKELKILLQQHI